MTTKLKRAGDPVEVVERIERTASSFDFALSDEEMAERDALDRTGGSGKAVESKWWR